MRRLHIASFCCCILVTCLKIPIWLSSLVILCLQRQRKSEYDAAFIATASTFAMTNALQFAWGLSSSASLRSSSSSSVIVAAYAAGSAWHEFQIYLLAASLIELAHGLEASFAFFFSALFCMLALQLLAGAIIIVLPESKSWDKDTGIWVFGTASATIPISMFVAAIVRIAVTSSSSSYSLASDPLALGFMSASATIVGMALVLFGCFFLVCNHLLDRRRGKQQQVQQLQLEPRGMDDECHLCCQ